MDVMEGGSRLRKEVLDLSLLGLRQVDIAEKLGITQGRVSQLLKEARSEWRTEGQRSYEEHVEDALATCRRLMASLERGIAVGDPRSVDSATRLVDRIAKLLGLDHRDRISERAVRVEEAKVQIIGSAVATMLDHLEITGERRIGAIEVLQRELEQAGDA